MYKLYSKKLSYNINMTPYCFMEKLKNNTTQNTNYSEIVDYDFSGIINEDTFEIQAIPSSGRRGLFNPILYGNILPNGEYSKLTISMKCKKTDMFFLILWIVICSVFSLIIYEKSLEVDYLRIFVLILPITILIIVNLFFLAVAKINFKDAQERIEKLL